MRRLAIVLIAVMMGTGYSFGQSNGLPQWKVVKEIHVEGGTSQHPRTPIFTATSTGLYRLSVYLSVSSPTPANAGYSIRVTWSDKSGEEIPLSLAGLATGDRTYQSIDSKIISPQVAVPMTIGVYRTDPPPQDATCDVSIIVERLTH